MASLADGKVPAGNAVGGIEGLVARAVQCSYPYSILRIGVQYSIFSNAGPQEARHSQASHLPLDAFILKKPLY